MDKMELSSIVEKALQEAIDQWEKVNGKIRIK